MAITRLTDIVTVFESKWVYGDVKFGYEGEVNQDHDTQYPLMLIQPPSSIMPEIYEGREEYEFEINFYNLFSQSAQSVVTLQKRWDNLQDMANEWLDFVLKNYQDVTVEAFLNDESIEIERVKDVANDKLVQIKLIFTMSGFTKCFRPQSNFPSDYADLVVWLGADSNVTFDIASKRVSAVGDRSGNSNSVLQATKANQPLRYGYDGMNDKSYFQYDGLDDTLVSVNNLPVTTDFTIFEVSKISEANDNVFGWYNAGAAISIGTDVNGFITTTVNDGTTQLTTNTLVDNRDSNHVSILKKHNKRIDLEYYDAANSITATDNDSGFDNTFNFNSSLFNIGSYNSTNNMKGQFNELIIFNRALSAIEIADVRGYINLKYKIY
tara:strand:+ start:3576 stop:4715 length:1140 start_codon:yes stop_codon:yes gene_type:complete